MIQGPLLAADPAIRHGFTTRLGGVSRGPWGPLSLAARADQPADELRKNWEIALSGLGVDQLGRVAVLSQVHGARVVEITEPMGPEVAVAEADAAWTRARDLVLAVRVADCVPVLLSAPDGIAVAHAGWRGTAGGVVAATVIALCEGTGCAPAELVAAIGPCISGEAYEVGLEVVDGLRAAGVADADFLIEVPGARPHVDLRRAVEAQLRASGVLAVDQVGGCTWTDENLHSHRRDGASAGRLAGLIVRCR